MKKGYMYVLLCSDGSYYTGSTIDLELRLTQHQNGEGSNHTAKRLPVKLLYCEEYDNIADAFYREKQVQGWSRRKKEALINGAPNLLPPLSKAYRDLKKIVFYFKSFSFGFKNDLSDSGFESLSHHRKQATDNESTINILPSLNIYLDYTLIILH